MYDGVPLDEAQIADIKDQMKEVGITPPDFDSTEISYFNSDSSWGLRAFGGLSVNLLIVRVDATLMYNIFDGNIGASIGARIQL
jgi:hypothetical protein